MLRFDFGASALGRRIKQEAWVPMNEYLQQPPVLRLNEPLRVMSLGCIGVDGTPYIEQP